MIPPRLRESRLAIARGVAEQMDRRGMPVAYTAEQIGLSYGALTGRLNGMTSFDVIDLLNLAEVLGVDIRDLLPDADWRIDLDA